MFKFLYIFILLIISSLFGFSQSYGPSDGSNLFWKIEHPESKKTSYLFGTIHLIDKDKFILPKIVKKRIEKSDVLYLEISELADKSKGLELSMLKEGRMTDVLNKAQRDSLYAYTQAEFGMDSSAFENTFGKFKPLFFSQLSMVKLLASTKSYDLTISEIAKDKGMSVDGLETMEEQISLFDNMSDNLKAELIMQTVRYTGSSEEDWLKMQDLYLEQNILEMVQIDDYSPEMEHFMKFTINQKRNANWVSILDQELRKNNLFIAVGAAHLPGENGLIQSLSRKGYKVKPIKISLIKTP